MRGAYVDPREQIHGGGQEDNSQYGDVADQALIGFPAGVGPGNQHHQRIWEHQQPGLNGGVAKKALKEEWQEEHAAKQADTADDDNDG